MLKLTHLSSDALTSVDCARPSSTKWTDTQSVSMFSAHLKTFLLDWSWFLSTPR